MKATLQGGPPSANAKRCKRWSHPADHSSRDFRFLAFSQNCVWLDVPQAATCTPWLAAEFMVALEANAVASNAPLGPLDQVARKCFSQEAVAHHQSIRRFCGLARMQLRHEEVCAAKGALPRGPLGACASEWHPPRKCPHCGQVCRVSRGLCCHACGFWICQVCAHRPAWRRSLGCACGGRQERAARPRRRLCTADGRCRHTAGRRGASLVQLQ